MDLLDSIRQQVKQHLAFKDHPARTLDLEDRLLYLQGLALVMTIDGDNHAAEKEYLDLLIHSFFDQPGDHLQNLLIFAQKPDASIVPELGKKFSSSDIRFTFLSDALMLMHRDHRLHDREDSLFDSYSDLLEVSSSQKNLLRQLAKDLDEKKLVKRDGLNKFNYEFPVISVAHLCIQNTDLNTSISHDHKQVNLECRPKNHLKFKRFRVQVNGATAYEGNDSHLAAAHILSNNVCCDVYFYGNHTFNMSYGNMKKFGTNNSYEMVSRILRGTNSTELGRYLHQECPEYPKVN